MRLVDGNTANQGRVEVYHNQKWLTVCHNKWDMRDANVVCRSLGYGVAAEAKSNSYFGKGAGSILLHAVQCRGTESNLKHCSNFAFKDNSYFNGVKEGQCARSDVAGVVCLESGIITICISNFDIESRLSLTLDRVT